MWWSLQLNGDGRKGRTAGLPLSRPAACQRSRRRQCPGHRSCSDATQKDVRLPGRLQPSLLAIAARGLDTMLNNAAIGQQAQCRKG
jgi:hypothetical protein